MAALTALEHVQKTRIIAILRGNLLGKETEIAAALVDAGVTAIEVSAVSAGFAEMIRNLSRSFAGRAAIGAGTILKLAELHQAVSAGASFVVSPNIDSRVVAETKRLGLASFPGAYTATEVVQAIDAGADAVKIFPAVSLGPSYIRALRGPLPTARLVPTGGIDLGNLRSFLEAGAFALGIGSELVGATEMQAGGSSALRDKGLSFVQAAKEAPSYE
jgi:Entner-Doudoroff aldolase